MSEIELAVKRKKQKQKETHSCRNTGNYMSPISVLFMFKGLVPSRVISTERVCHMLE